MNPNGTITGNDVQEPALSADFAPRVIQRARAERKRRRERRRIAVAAAFAITGALLFHVIGSGPGGAKLPPQPQSLVAGEWDESNSEQAGWPLEWDATTEQSVDGYFFPDFGPLADFTSAYQTEEAPALDAVLGFDDCPV